jgi:DNA-binding transcriptional LysR family regulator
MTIPNTLGPGAKDAALLDVRLLRLFDLLYRTRSVTKTAEALGQAQPTISIWLNRLRRELGDPLFVRTPTGMQPTLRADSLIGTARSAIEILQRLTAPVQQFDPATATRRFRICMTDASHVTLLPRLLAAFRTQAPLMRIEALQINANTGPSLLSGEADLALGLVPGLDAGFYQQSLYTQDWICLAAPDHPRISARLDLADYIAEAHVSIVSGTGQKLLEAALAEQGIHRRVLLELPGFLGLSAIVRSTDLIATMPRQSGETVAATHGLRVFACPVPIPSFTVKQYWHARYHHDNGNTWLRGLCAELFQHRISHAA